MKVGLNVQEGPLMVNIRFICLNRGSPSSGSSSGRENPSLNSLYSRLSVPIFLLSSLYFLLESPIFLSLFHLHQVSFNIVVDITVTDEVIIIVDLQPF